MSVRPRKWKNKDGTVSHSWVVDYHGNDGRRHNEQFDRRREAENAWAKIRLDLGKNIHVPASQSATVSEAAEIWYRACEANELEPTTIDEYRRNKDEIVAHLGAVKLPQLTTGMVLDFRNKVATEPPKAKSPQAQQAKPSKAKAKRFVSEVGRDLGRGADAEHGRPKCRL
jgi:integrase